MTNEEEKEEALAKFDKAMELSRVNGKLEMLMSLAKRRMLKSKDVRLLLLELVSEHSGASSMEERKKALHKEVDSILKSEE